MSKENRYQLSVDFYNSRLQQNVRVVDYMIGRHGGDTTSRGQTNYLLDAYTYYMANELNDACDFVLEVKKMRYLVDKHNFSCKQDVINYFKVAPGSPVEQLPPAGKRYFLFQTENEKEKELYLLLKDMDDFQRTYAICTFIKCYFTSGLDEEYLEFSSERFLQILVNQYNDSESDEKTLNKIDDIVETMLLTARIPIDEETPSGFETDDIENLLGLKRV